MKKLLKAYGFNSDMMYYERIVFLRLHNDIKASYLMFKDMPVKHRKLFCISALSSWSSGLTNEQIMYFINLI